MEEYIYLDNAATTFPKPEAVYQALDRANRNAAVNAGRGSYALAEQAKQLIEDTRGLLLTLTKAKPAAEVVFTPSATFACNQIFGGLPWKREDIVYVSPYEHNAVMRTLDYMEVWYWSAILSGEFKIEQNRAFIRNLQNVLSEIQNIKESDKKFTKALCNNVLTDKKFADRDIVLMKNPSVYPEEVIGNTICQFYLSETYSDILKPLPEKNNYQPQTLSALNNSVKLQKHHIMPIGSLSVKYKDANKTTESRRKDNSSPYNSPLNFLLISEKANGLIQNSTLKEYFEFCDQTALNNVDIKDHTFTDMSDREIGYRIGDEALQLFLEKRYDDFKSRITSKCRNLLNCPDICCGEGGN